MSNQWRAYLSSCAIAIAIAVSANVASAQANVYVGYADQLRGSNFPDPWHGSPGVQYFQGTTDAAADAGAIMIQNNTASAFSIDAFSVDIGPYFFNLWVTPLSLSPGMSAIFTETSHYNFDTSDILSQSCDHFDFTVPIVNMTINGTSSSFNDTGLILTTGGHDVAACGLNEALGWRLIGTTGVENPGNQIAPEPATIGLFGTGLMGLLAAGFLRRRKD